MTNEHNVTLDNRAELAGKQTDMLVKILKAAEQTSYGSQHGFAAISSADTYAASVPANTYHSLRSMIEMQRMTGDAVLTADAIVQYRNAWAGTGSGRQVPVTRVELDHRYARLEQTATTLRASTDFYRGCVLDLTSLTASGWDPYEATLLAGETVLPSLSAVEDIEARAYLLVLMALSAPGVSGILAPDAEALDIFMSVLDRHADSILTDAVEREISISDRLSMDVVETVKLFLTGDADRIAGLGTRETLTLSDICNGTPVLACDGSLGMTVHASASMLFDIGCWLPEGALSLATGEGHCAINADDCYLELREPGTEAMIGLHEAQKAIDYRVHVTTRSGLYRYQLEGIGRIDGWHKGVPTLQFRRAGTMASVREAGMPTHSQALAAARSALNELGVRAPFVRLCSDDGHGAFTMIVNRVTFGDRCTVMLADAFDHHLRMSSLWYERARRYGQTDRVTIRFSEATAGDASPAPAVARVARTTRPQNVSTNGLNSSSQVQALRG